MNPVIGSEQGGLRPVLVLSHNIFNERSGTVIAVAITSQPQKAGFPLTLELSGKTLPKQSWIKISQIRTLSEERLDMSFFDDRYRNDDTGRKAIAPKLLIKIVLLGYSRGMISSRSLERACRENITFMALARGKSPDHSTIAAFISSMWKEIEPLFTKVPCTQY